MRSAWNMAAEDTAEWFVETLRRAVAALLVAMCVVLGICGGLKVAKLCGISKPAAKTPPASERVIAAAEWAGLASAKPAQAVTQ